MGGRDYLACVMFDPFRVGRQGDDHSLGPGALPPAINSHAFGVKRGQATLPDCVSHGRFN